MGSGSSHCNRCQQDVDSYGNVQVIHQDYCALWSAAADRYYSSERIYELTRTIESQNRTIDDLQSKVWSSRKLNQEIIRLKKQKEDFRKAYEDLWKANNDLAKKNKSLQITIGEERKVMYQSHQDLRKQATDLKHDLEERIYAYEDELNQANEKIILDGEKIQNQRNQLRNLNQKQEKLVLRPVLTHIFVFKARFSYRVDRCIILTYDSWVCLKTY